MTLEIIAIVFSALVFATVIGLAIHALIDLVDPNVARCHECYRWTKRVEGQEPLCFHCRHPELHLGLSHRHPVA